MKTQPALVELCLLLTLAGCAVPAPPAAPDAGDSIPTESSRVKQLTPGVTRPCCETADPQGSAPLSTASVALPPSADLLRPADLAYLGAFRLPEGGERPLNFTYGGSAMTVNPGGDPDGAADGFPGSLFIMGHDRLPYGELPNGSQVAEVGIPAPVIAPRIADLNRAGFLQDFHDITAGYFAGEDELPRTGMLYLDVPGMGPAIHLAWGQHLEPEPFLPTHAWFDPNLDAPALQGPWYVGDLSPYSLTGYLLEIPDEWAQAYTRGMRIATGRFRDGGWSGMGPALAAYRPWADPGGEPAAANARLEAVNLLAYRSSQDSDQIEGSLAGYQHPDEWEGAAWLTTPGGKSAVVFAGTKSVGEKYWYGYANPAGANLPCVEEEMLGQFPLCRLSSGEACPPEDLAECAGHNDYRGWWSTAWQAQLIFYNPDNLGRVALGEMEAWEPQPYAVLEIDPVLFLNPDGVEADLLGQGAQRRYRVGEAAFDRLTGRLYLLELFADQASPVVHVWQVGS